MQFVENKMALDLAHVLKITLEILMKVVDPSASLTLIVPQTRPVYEISVLIHAQAPVDKMQFVKWLIICQIVNVYQVIRVILIDSVQFDVMNVSNL